MNYNFKVNDFDGPLDVLLHLIKESKIDIMDIPIVSLTDQYLAYINQMDLVDLSNAALYLVLASELTYMKSKYLLPNLSEEDEEELESMSLELKNRLLEYQSYKDAAFRFKDLEEKRQDLYSKSPSSLKEYKDKEISLDSDVTLNDLLSAFQRFLERKVSEKPLATKVVNKEISVEERVASIKEYLKKHKRIEFFDLFDNISKSYVVVTFLSILEMAKNNEIKITQENNFDKIYCEGLL